MGKKIFKPPSMDTIISAEHPNHALYSSKFFCHNGLLVGRSCKDIFETLLQFDLSVLPLSLTIISSTLRLFLSTNEFPSEEKTLEVFQILSDWHQEKICWEKRPILMELPAITVDITHHVSSFITCDITPLADEWYSGQSANLGVLLKMSDDFSNNLIGFSSGNCSNSRFWPSLEIDFLSPCNGRSPETLDITLHVTTTNVKNFTSPINILTFDYTYLVTNNASSIALVFLEVSPNGINWEIQSSATKILPGQLVTLVPNSIAKFSRLGYQSLKPGSHTALTIYIQGVSE